MSNRRIKAKPIGKSTVMAGAAQRLFAPRHPLDLLAHEAFHQRRQVVVEPVLQHRTDHLLGDLVEGLRPRLLERLVQLTKCRLDLAPRLRRDDRLKPGR